MLGNTFLMPLGVPGPACVKSFSSNGTNSEIVQVNRNLVRPESANEQKPSKKSDDLCPRAHFANGHIDG